MKKTLLNANLLKKYHQNLVYDYTEYPTKSNWNYDYGSEDYKKSLEIWLKKNKNAPVMFYVHTPFCEQLCYFCLCSKEITQNYENVKKYLYNYLYKEIELLFNFLNEKNIKLNVKEIYFGGGSPTYYRAEEFKNLIDKLKGCFDFSKIGDFTVEIDPRRVDEEKLLFYNDCGVNRLSFGVQDFDLEVQTRINRVQPPELLDKLLTRKVRGKFRTFNFDLLVGLPGQTNKTMEETVDEVIKLRPPEIQPMMMHYKPQARKYMIKMLKDGPLPDFFDRKLLYATLNEKLIKAGYTHNGYESYALPSDPISKAMDEKKAYYGSIGCQKGEAINFVAVGSSAHGCLGDEYYSQNYYEQNLYKQSLDKGKFPIYRGMKLSADDRIRRHIIKTLRTYFEIDYAEIEEKFKINFKKHFDKEINNLKEFIKDDLAIVSNESISITNLGTNFSPQIINVFDGYNPQKINQLNVNT